METLELGTGESLPYAYDPPGSAGKTLVFVNALTGSTGMWQAEIGPVARQAGFGTLCYNFRGQTGSRFGAGTDLTPGLVISDLNRLLDHLDPPAPVLVGLSIGGLFAAQAELAHRRAAGLVLINTLRKPSRRLAWINRSMIELAKLGGGRLVLAANAPMIVNPEFLEVMWPAAFADEPFEAMTPEDGLFRLMAGSVDTDWDFPYEELKVPVLLMTGTHDRVFRIEADIAELSDRIADHTHIRYEDAGHLIPAERTAQFIDDLLGFASRV